MLVKRADKVCTCVTLAIFTKLTIFIVENPIICLLWNFTGYFRYTQATILLNKQFLKPKVYAANAFKVCTCKSEIFDYVLFTVCSSVSDEISIHAIAIMWLQQLKHNRQLDNCAPLWLRGGQSFDPPWGFVVTYIDTRVTENKQNEGSYNSRTIIDTAPWDPKFCRHSFGNCIRLWEKSFQWRHHPFMTSSSWPSLKNSGF